MPHYIFLPRSADRRRTGDFRSGAALKVKSSERAALIDAVHRALFAARLFVCARDALPRPLQMSTVMTSRT